MNRKKKLLRGIAVAICLVLIMGVNVGISAAETDTKYVSNINELLSAIKYADDGDVIVVYGEITISTNLEVPEGQITIERGDMNSRLITRNGVNVDFQNMIFDGKSWKSPYSFITLQGDFSFENCTFRNCGDPDNLSSSGCIGGAVQIKQGSGTFNNCTFRQNNAVSGGSGEPIEQTIRVEAPDGSTGADGMTLNVNVNVGEDGTPDQEAEASPQQQDGASWYQVAVLCLLSAILVCVIKKR